MKNININFLLIVILIILIIVLFIISLTGIDNTGYKIDRLEEIVIQDGDTLWNIATKYCPDNMDIRKYIYCIEEDNDIKAGELKPGQTIKIRKYVK